MRGLQLAAGTTKVPYVRSSGKENAPRRGSQARDTGNQDSVYKQSYAHTPFYDNEERRCVAEDGDYCPRPDIPAIEWWIVGGYTLALLTIIVVWLAS